MTFYHIFVAKLPSEDTQQRERLAVLDALTKRGMCNREVLEHLVDAYIEQSRSKKPKNKNTVIIGEEVEA